jgi:hypothetical protein
MPPRAPTTHARPHCSDRRGQAPPQQAGQMYSRGRHLRSPAPWGPSIFGHRRNKPLICPQGCRVPAPPCHASALTCCASAPPCQVPAPAAATVPFPWTGPGSGKCTTTRACSALARPCCAPLALCGRASGGAATEDGGMGWVVGLWGGW